MLSASAYTAAAARFLHQYYGLEAEDLKLEHNDTQFEKLRLEGYPPDVAAQQFGQMLKLDRVDTPPSLMRLSLDKDGNIHVDDSPFAWRQPCNGQ